ncbi:MAG: hypothetical protein R3200_04740 [Xanthomonadales bacterium]|nr:hypothetical protein [Xanthomonadales bacterium]
MTSRKLRKPLDTPAIPFPALAGVLGLLSIGALAGVAGLFGQPGATEWGAFTSNFLFVAGLSQFGIVFSAMLRVVKAQWGTPFQRIGEMATLAFFPIALIGFLMIYTGGRETLLYWTTDSTVHNPWLTDQGLLVRNLIGMILFYGIGYVYYRQSLRADAESRPGPHTDRARITAGWVLVFFIVNFTFLAWDFGMMAIPHYHSTVYPMHVILGNLNGGTGYMLILYLLFHHHVAASDQLDVARLRWLGILLTAFTLLWLYMFWAQFFVTWFGNLPHEMEPLWRQMYGHYGPYFWTMMSCVFFIPFLALISAWLKKTLWAMTVLSLIVIVGVWLHRFLMVFPVLSPDHVALSTLSELLFLLGLPALHLLILLVWIRLQQSPATAGNRQIAENT